MAKKLISIDDSKTGEAALPDVVNTVLRNTYVRGEVADQSGTPVPGVTARIVLDANGEVDDIIILEES